MNLIVNCSINFDLHYFSINTANPIRIIFILFRRNSNVSSLSPEFPKWIFQNEVFLACTLLSSISHHNHWMPSDRFACIKSIHNSLWITFKRLTNCTDMDDQWSISQSTNYTFKIILNILYLFNLNLISSSILNQILINSAILIFTNPRIVMGWIYIKHSSI